jgi:tRNA pseudouridine38-40 synthase
LNNYKLKVAYNGKYFCGFQIQDDCKTVEGELKRVLSQVFDEDIKIIASGRTDAGVHAIDQVVNIKTSNKRRVENLRSALKKMLPEGVDILDIEEVGFDFNARKCAVKREYKYIFSDSEIPISLKDFVCECNFEIDTRLFSDLEKLLVGKKDFRRFRKLGSNEKTTVREIFKVDFRLLELVDIYSNKFSCYEFRIIGSSFLYRMVRNIMGAIFEIFRGKRTLEDFSKLFEADYLGYQYSAAPAKGLGLYKVYY